MYDWLLLFGIVLWLGISLWYWRQPIASTYHPITFYLIFHGVLFAIRPVLAWWLGYRSMYRVFEFDPSMDVKITVLLAADLALVIFVAVAARAGNVVFTRAPARLSGPAPGFEGPLLLALAICTPLALLSLRASLSSIVAGSGTMIVIDGIAVNTTGNGYYTDAQLMLGPLMVLVAWVGRFRLWALAPAALFVVAKAGSGGRWPFVMCILSVALFWMYERRLRWPTPRLVLLALPLIALFTIIGEDRGAGIRQLVGATPAVAQGTDYFHERPLEPMDYANMEFFEYLVHVVPTRTGTYGWFLSNLQVFTEPVPRILWPGKPVGAPIQLFSLQDYGRPTGMSLSVPGVGWMEAGWIGVVLWSALFGLAYGKLYKAYVRSNQTKLATAAYMIVLPVTLQGFRDGTLLTVLKTSFYPLAPIAVWMIFMALAARTNAGRLARRQTT